MVASLEVGAVNEASKAFAGRVIGYSHDADDTFRYTTVIFHLPLGLSDRLQRYKFCGWPLEKSNEMAERFCELMDNIKVWDLFFGKYDKEAGGRFGYLPIINQELGVFVKDHKVTGFCRLNEVSTMPVPD